MKYTNEIEINKSVEDVIRLFDNADNLSKWMEGLQSFTHISGTPGQPGAKSKLVFKVGKREMTLIETVTVRNLPKEFTGTYEAPDGKGALNIVKNEFVKLSPTKTKYISESEFQFKGFMVIVAAIMKGAFKKQSLKHVNNFKNFAESV